MAPTPPNGRPAPAKPAPGSIALTPLSTWQLGEAERRRITRAAPQRPMTTYQLSFPVARGDSAATREQTESMKAALAAGGRDPARPLFQRPCGAFA
jgi:hypothetical protein